MFHPKNPKFYPLMSTIAYPTATTKGKKAEIIE